MRREGDDSLFEARLEDLCRRVERRCEPSAGDFLSPGEAALAKTVLARLRPDGIPVFFGGYEGSERTRLLLLPSYMDDGAPMDAGRLLDQYPEVARETVAAVKIRGSGYRKLSHRDYMGSVLALGIERSVIGDIVPEDEFSATVFCAPGMVPFLTQELTRIGNDAVKTEPFEIPQDFTVTRELQEVRDTVASSRLDCIVAALAGLSREKAQLAIRAGEVDVDYLPEERVDRTVAAESVIAIRRVGKFIVRSVDEQTKKGRYRLVADKYI